MIKVTCDACGKSFGAKDELAGRKGKCPSCGAPIVVGGAAPSAAPARAAAPAPGAPAVSSSSGSRRGGSSRSGGSRRGGGASRGGKDYTTITAVALVVAVGLAIGGYFLSQADDVDAYLKGNEERSAGNLEAALAWYEKVPVGDSCYELAQQDIVTVREMLATRAAEAARRHGDASFNYIVDLEKVWVDGDGQGPLKPTYAPNTRYLLKRCRAFLDEYPDDPRRKDVELIQWKYSEVASLDKPPTTADVRAELGFRGGATRTWDLRAMEEAVEEFVRMNPGDDSGARELWSFLDERNKEFWTRTIDRSSKWIDQANWKALLGDLATYFACYEGTQRLRPDPEAVKLRAKAEAEAQAAGS